MGFKQRPYSGRVIRQCLKGCKSGLRARSIRTLKPRVVTSSFIHAGLKIRRLEAVK